MPPVSYKNPTEASAGLTSAFQPTNDAQRQAIANASALVPLTPSALTPQTATTPVVAPEVPVPAAPALGTYNTQPEASPDLYGVSPSEKLLYEQMLGLNNDTAALGSEETAKTKADERYGVQEKQGVANSLKNQFDALTQEANGLDLKNAQLQEQNRAMGGSSFQLSANDQATQRAINTQKLGVAIRQHSVAAQYAAANNDLATAMSLADRAIKIEYQPKKDALEARRANLELALKNPALTQEQKKRADAQERAIKAEERAIEKQEVDKKEISAIGLTALGYGADQATFNRIQNAKTPQEAMSIGAKFLVDPKAKYEIDSIRLDNLVKQANLDRIRKETDQIGQPTAADKKQAEKDKEAEKAMSTQAKAQIPVVERKIGEIDYLLKNLSSNVGPNIFTRTDLSDKTGLTADKKEFSGKMHQIVAGLTLDALVSAKERGATFGALSDGERITLSQAASAINDWEIWKDKEGNIVPTGTEGARPTGEWAVTEEAFMEELNKIRDFAELDLTRKRGQVFTPSESDILDELFSDTSTSTPPNFDPANYF